MRNNLITKNLTFKKDGETKTAKWSHLVQLLKENPGYKGIRLIPKLTEHHLNPEKLNKMKVKFASQVFSRTVASNMVYLADKGILPTECKETADLLLFMDNVFDSVNGSHAKNKNAKPLLGPATITSAHIKTWTKAKSELNSMEFVTPASRAETVPTIKNWVWTLEGIQVLLNKLRIEYGVISVWLRHLNPDPLENFFGAVRSHGCQNVNLTCDQFEFAFATLLINKLNIVHTQGKNCENDLCYALCYFVLNENTEATSTCTVDIENILEINFEDIENKEKDPRILAPLQYAVIKTSIYSLVNFDFIKCNTHKTKMIDYLINTVIRFMTFNYCKVINKILSGRRQVDDEDDKVQMKPKKYNTKCFKKKI
ncbi:unnamed protein product [Euphydryas editha]|uniref:Transposable element P transposase n=1 Tax=Euphydryas editha TaxID=104508 RepID=A0AAU9US10_EUPED|nr:unnamed protein product [Euphydryas editha]